MGSSTMSAEQEQDPLKDMVARYHYASSAPWTKWYMNWQRRKQGLPPFR